MGRAWRIGDIVRVDLRVTHRGIGKVFEVVGIDAFIGVMKTGVYAHIELMDIETGRTTSAASWSLLLVKPGTGEWLPIAPDGKAVRT